MIYTLTSIVSLSGLTGCGNGVTPEYDYSPKDGERYKNHIEIEGQWQSGIGDPFVMRYNGKYYLYPSTPGGHNGIKVFTSDDMINWEYAGFAVSEDEPTVCGAYAPEVKYYNGWFYMCQSRDGKGHYIYRSAYPDKDFRLFSKSDVGTEGDIGYGNLGMSIDGSFYIDEDGKLYIIHTSLPAGLVINEITDPENISPNTLGTGVNVADANLHHWIEGPGTFRRGDKTYLTYTGNHVVSRGYRIAYSYIDGKVKFDKMTQPAENVLFIDSESDHYGLGHSSNVYGPNLDSIYTPYHNHISNGRRYNVDRYFVSGGLVTANGNTHDYIIKPENPDAFVKSGDELTANGDGYYLNGETEGFFTAEFNFNLTDEQKLIFGEKQDSRYTVEFNGNTVRLVKTVSGKRTEIAERTFERNFAKDKLCNVRIENGDGIGYVYVNDMKAFGYEAEKSDGKVGYAVKDGVYYTAVVNEVFGTSDFETAKNFPTEFPATTYAKGEYRGFAIADAKVVKKGIRVGEKQSVKEIGDFNAVVLKKGDWVKYGIDVSSAGEYYITAKVSAETSAKIKIKIGDKEFIRNIEKSKDASAETVNVPLGKILCDKGLSVMKVEVTEGKAEIVSFKSVLMQNSATMSAGGFESVYGSTEITDNYTKVIGTGLPSVAYAKDVTVTDFKVNCSLKVSEEAGNNLGIMIRAKDFSYHKDQASQAWRGYYLQISGNLAVLYRYDYGDEMLAAIPFDPNNGNITVEIECVAEKITVKINGASMSARDDYAFLSGHLGLYSVNGEITLKSIEYTDLGK